MNWFLNGVRPFSESVGSESEVSSVRDKRFLVYSILSSAWEALMVKVDSGLARRLPMVEDVERDRPGV